MIKPRDLLFAGSKTRRIFLILKQQIPNLAFYYYESAMELLSNLPKHNSIAIFADANLEDINGYSLLAIIRGTYKEKNKNTLMYIIKENLAKETRHYIKVKRVLAQNMQPSILAEYVYGDIIHMLNDNKLFNSAYHTSEYDNILLKQEELLPKMMENHEFSVCHIFSPYSSFSGDSCDYGVEKDTGLLCGFLIDCAGHSIDSFSQVRELRMVYRLFFRNKKKNRDLATVMEKINQEMFNEHGDSCQCSVGFLFQIDFKNNVLFYCTAGLTKYCLVRDKKLEVVSMKGFLLGFLPKIKYEFKRVSLNLSRLKSRGS